MEPFISSGLPKNSQPHSAWMVVVLLDVDVHTSACGLSCFSVLRVFNLLCVHGGKVGLWVIWYKNAHIAQHWCDKLEEDVCGSTRVYIPCVLFSGFLLHLFLHIWSDICTFQSKFGLGNKNTCFSGSATYQRREQVQQRTEPRDGHFFCISSSHFKGAWVQSATSTLDATNTLLTAAGRIHQSWMWLFVHNKTHTCD